MTTRDSLPGIKLGVYLKEVDHMVSKDAGNMMERVFKFTPTTAVQHRALWAAKKRQQRKAQTGLMAA